MFSESCKLNASHCYLFSILIFPSSHAVLTEHNSWLHIYKASSDSLKAIYLLGLSPSYLLYLHVNLYQLFSSFRLQGFKSLISRLSLISIVYWTRVYVTAPKLFLYLRIRILHSIYVLAACFGYN
jgi:hypothetical protein